MSDAFQRAVARARPLAELLLASALVGGVAALGAWFVQHPLSGCQSQLYLQFTGTATCPDHGAGDLARSLSRDDVFAIAYGVLLSIAAWKIPVQEHLDRRLDILNKLARWGPPGAAAADVAENELLRYFTDFNGSDLVVQQSARAWITALALVKWTLLAGAVAVLLLRVANRRPGPTAPTGQDEVVATPKPRDLAVCCSGGGIRSAGFSLGVLHRLDAAGNGAVTKRIQLMAAVSGGNYAATAWCLRSASGEPNTRPAHEVICRLLGTDPLDAPTPSPLVVVKGPSPIRSRVARGRHRYLAHGYGGLPRAGLWAVAAILSNAVQILVVLVVVGWPLGQLLVADGFHPELPRAFGDAGVFTIAPEQLRPIRDLVIVALGAAISTLITGRWKFQPIMLSVSGVLLAVAVLYGALVAAGPWLLVQATNLGNGRPLATIGGISLATVAGVLVRIFANPLRRYAPRLGGAALAVLLLVVLGKIVHDSAAGAGVFSASWLWGLSVVLTLLLAYGIDTQTWSMRELYRARLAAAFAREDQRPATFLKRVFGGDEALGTTWATLAKKKPVPELLVCCSASQVGLQPNGAPADSFTVSQHRVRHHRAAGTTTIPTADYVPTLRSWALKPLRAPASWLATSGAAFASAMGRKGLGSTNALMAAVNLDLGVWLPAPHAVRTGRKRFAPVGLGHLCNEIFGLYSDRDEMIFVSDGGHIENLGLVELLRSGARRIVCIDASGDPPGSFATLRLAIRQADTSLPDEQRMAFDLAELDASPVPPLVSAYRIPIAHWDTPADPVGTIYYAKLQGSADQPLELRQFANSDPRFPNYSTANQLLDDQQFAFLLLAGGQAGDHLLTLLEEDGLGVFA